MADVLGVSASRADLLNDIKCSAAKKLAELSLKRHQVNELQQRMMSLHFNALNNQINSLHNDKTMELLSSERMRAQNELQLKLQSPKQHINKSLHSTDEISDGTSSVTTIDSPNHATVHHINDISRSPQLQQTLTAMQSSQDNDMAIKLAKRANLMARLNNEVIKQATAKSHQHREIHSNIQHSRMKINSLKDELVAKSTQIANQHNTHRAVAEHVHQRQQSHSFKILLNDLQNDNITKLKSTMQKSEQISDAALAAKLQFRATTGRKASFSHSTTVG